MKREISPFIRLNQKDNVVVARRDVPAGMAVESEGFTTRTEVPAGYKAAARDIRKGEPILKYNTCIGFAAEDTPAGTMMHSHNIVFEHVDLDYAFSRDYHPTELLPPEQRATFQGFVRPDGRVATRNYIGILVASNCAATVARKIANHFTPERLAAYPNVSGVVPFVTGLGCGMEMTGPFMDLLRRTIMGYATNPNLGAAIVTALGCERNNIDGMFEHAGLQESETLQKLVIQDVGGTAKAVVQSTTASIAVNRRMIFLLLIFAILHLFLAGVRHGLRLHHALRQGDEAAGIGLQEGRQLPVVHLHRLDHADDLQVLLLGELGLQGAETLLLLGDLPGCGFAGERWEGIRPPRYPPYAGAGESGPVRTARG